MSDLPIHDPVAEGGPAETDGETSTADATATGEVPMAEAATTGDEEEAITVTIDMAEYGEFKFPAALLEQPCMAPFAAFALGMTEDFVKEGVLTYEQCDRALELYMKYGQELDEGIEAHREKVAKVKDSDRAILNSIQRSKTFKQVYMGEDTVKILGEGFKVMLDCFKHRKGTLQELYDYIKGCVVTNLTTPEGDISVNILNPVWIHKKDVLFGMLDKCVTHLNRLIAGMEFRVEQAELPGLHLIGGDDGSIPVRFPQTMAED